MGQFLNIIRDEKYSTNNLVNNNLSRSKINSNSKEVFDFLSKKFLISNIIHEFSVFSISSSIQIFY